MGCERIGDYLVRTGALSNAQRWRILRLQRRQPDQLFGWLAVRLRYIDDDALGRYLQSNGYADCV